MRFTAMDARVAFLKASMPTLPSLIDEAISTVLDAKLQLYFGKFRRGLHYRGNGGGPSTSNVSDNQILRRLSESNSLTVKSMTVVGTLHDCYGLNSLIFLFSLTTKIHWHEFIR